MLQVNGQGKARSRPNELSANQNGKPFCQSDPSANQNGVPFCQSDPSDDQNGVPF